MPPKRKAKEIDTASLPMSSHPALHLVKAANASKIRTHGAKYHRVFDNFRLSDDIQQPLLNWYGKRGDLPWRSDLSDAQLKALSEQEKAQRAYEVWVSEIMLQQTQVATVIPYFQRWLAAFPTVHDLAKADIEKVNGIWKGLGYYSRASRLLSGAKTVVESYKGKLPSDPDELVKKIEGIGPYTAGAIASIAYGVRAATVDGNIQRVICRLQAIHGDMKKKAVLDYIWEVADELVPESRSGHWNQALMDLGATVCTPKNPQCGSCPMNKVCLAYAETCIAAHVPVKQDIEDLTVMKKACTLCLPLEPPSHDRDVTLYPLKVIKKKSRDEDIAVCVVEWRQAGSTHTAEDKILLVKRPKTGLLAGLDEFPSVILPDQDTTTSSRNTLVKNSLQELLNIPPKLRLKDGHNHENSLEVLSYAENGSVKHIYSHINATFHASHLVLKSDKPPAIIGDTARCRWVPKTAVEEANISTGTMKVWNLLFSSAVVEKPSKMRQTKKVKPPAKPLEAAHPVEALVPTGKRRKGYQITISDSE